MVLRDDDFKRRVVDNYFIASIVRSYAKNQGDLCGDFQTVNPSLWYNSSVIWLIIMQGIFNE